MPIYEYECTACGHTFEKLVSSHRSRPQCPECNGKPRRLLSSFAAHQGGSSGPACQAAEQCPTAGQCPSGQCPLG
jgi:putative FmdB family regulatory protein